MAVKPTYEELEQRVQELESIIKNVDNEKHDPLSLSIVQDLPLLICTYLKSGEITFVNKAYCTYFNKNFDELVGSNFLLLIPEKDRETVIQNILDLTPQSPSQTHEHRVISPDGTIGWQKWTNMAVFNEQGEAVHFKSIGQDITEQKYNELAVENFFEQPMNIHLIVDFDGIIHRCNKGFIDTLDYTHSEIEGKIFFDLIHPEDLDATKEEMRSLELGNSTFYFENRYRHKKGGYRLLAWSAIASNEDSLIYAVAKDITESREAEEAVRENENKFRQLFDNSPIGKSITYVSGEIHANDAFSRMLGYSKEEFQNIKWQAITHPADIALSQKVVESMISGTNDSDRFLKRYIHKNGSVIWADVSTRLQRDREGDPHYFITAVNNITERKMAEDALQESEGRLRSLINALPDLVWLKDINGVYLGCNNRFEKFFGAKQMDIIGKTDYDFMTKDLADFFRFHDKAAIEKGGPHINEEEITFADDGHSEILETIKTPIYGFDGQISEVLGIGRDITDRKKAEENLRSILDHSPIVIWCFDGEKYSYISKEWFRYTGQATDTELTIDRWIEQVHPDDLEMAGKVWQKNWEAKTKHTNDFRLRGRDGKYKSIHCHAFPIYDDKGKFLYFQGFNVDVSDLKKMENSIVKMQKMESIGNLAGGIAHDFNNILFPIIGMSELLLEDLPSGSPERENAEEILMAGKRGGELIKQILAFSRQSEHKMAPTRIQNILKEVLKLSRSSIPTYIEINKDIQQDCGIIMADPTQIHQICMNIITNAYHALEKKGGEITVVLKEKFIDLVESAQLNIRSSKYAVLSISDNGHGMSEGLISKIFDPYFTTKERGKGTGLGLSVVYGIVKEHKGNIKVNSEIGKGTTFDIYLPLMKKRAKYESQEKAEELIGGDEHILLVDDERPIINLGKQMLERMGYKVTTRLNSVDALEAFKLDPELYDLVITDMSMPNITGDKLAIEIKAVRPDIPIILCTGFSEIIDEEEAKAIGVNGFLMKPLVKSKIIKMVREVLDAQ